jgi:thioredoxin-related protein
MEPWALDAAKGMSDRVAFVEKDVNSDGSARAYGVRGTPTFIVIDAKGKELARFGYQRTAEEFVATIDSVLTKSGY